MSFGSQSRSSRVELYRRRKESNFSSSYQSFPEQPDPHSCLLVFKNFDFKPITEAVGSTGLRTPFQSAFSERSSGVGLRSTNSIELPFPKAIADNTSIRINGFERDPFTETVASKIKDYMDGTGPSNIGDLPGMLQGMGASMAQMMTGENMGAGINNIVKGIMGTDLKDVASGAQYLLRKHIPGDIGRSIDTVTGQTINPRETLAFEGVDLRTHQFSWDLFPSSQADSARIKAIVDLIKRKSLPEVTSLAGIPKAFLQYPSVVDIYLLGVNSEHFIKYKTSMIKDFSVDYGAGGGVAIMRGGKPAGVTLSMTLQELEIETSHDYGAAGNEIQQAVNQEEREQDNYVTSAGAG